MFFLLTPKNEYFYFENQGTMQSKTELLYTLALQRTPNIGDINAKKLIAHCGSAVNVFAAKSSQLLKIDGIGTYTIAELKSSKYLHEAEAELHFIQKHRIKVSTFLEEDYPKRLKYCADGPLVLFQSGNINFNQQRIISIVGTRKASAHGMAFCEKLISDLSPLDPLIVSGFAYGIDITAHKAAIANNLQNVACLAHGLNQIYPKTHQKYCSAVEKHGGFVTDFWSTSHPDRENFLKRNRIVAGISEATIVIESAEKGGSLVTAHIANSYDRDVFAVPGRTTDSQSVGCNNLIKQQRAHLLTSAADLVYILGWNIEKEPQKPIQKQLFINLEGKEKQVYESIQKVGKQELDILALDCKLPMHQLTPLLLQLELKGVVRPLPGKVFEAI